MDDHICKITRAGDVVVLVLTLNNITMEDNEFLKKTVSTLLDEGNKKILLDLSDTNFISSLVLASFVFMLKRAREAGGNLVMCSVKGLVEEVLSITDLDKVFEICPDRQAAILALARR